MYNCFYSNWPNKWFKTWFCLSDVILVGTSTSPAIETYQFPYIILSNEFSVKGQFTKADDTTFYINNDGGSGSCGTVDTTGPAEECTTTLNQFGPTNVYDGEYIVPLCLLVLLMDI